jgi:hypothetical protein
MPALSEKIFSWNRHASLNLAGDFGVNEVPRKAAWPPRGFTPLNRSARIVRYV